MWIERIPVNCGRDAWERDFDEKVKRLLSSRHDVGLSNMRRWRSRSAAACPQ